MIFERRAAIALADALQMIHDLQVDLHGPDGPPSTQREIMTEVLEQLDIDTDEWVVDRYLRWWEDAQQ